MKEINKSLLWIALILVFSAFQTSMFGQDDLYYEAPPTTTTEIVDDNNDPSNLTRRYDNDDSYYEDDDYAYEYSSRIRRFHRPVNTVDYYDPFFVDLYNYDPYFLPGTTIYTYGYNDYWTWRHWNRWNRWNRWNSIDYGWGSNSFGYNSWGFGGYNNFGWNSWNNPNVFNNYYYDPYWTWNGYNPYYCNNNGWFNNNNNFNNDGNNNNGYQPKTYTGVRRNGTNINPGYARINGNDRLSAPVKGNTPGLELNNRPNGRSVIKTAPVPGASDRDNIGRQNKTNAPTPNGRNPNTTQPNGRDDVKSAPTSREAEISRRLQDGQNNTDRPARTPAVDNAPRTPTRSQETTPTRRTEPSTDRPSRPAGGGRQEATQQRTEPARERTVRPSTGTQESTPTRRYETSDDRPARSSTESRPSRSESSGRSFDSGSSGRSSGGNSGGNSGGGNSGGSSGKSSGGGRGGRN